MITIRRQGDVVLYGFPRATAEQVTKNWEVAPRDSKSAGRMGETVLAHGEVTGHAHTVDAPMLYLKNADRMCDALTKALKQHGLAVDLRDVGQVAGVVFPADGSAARHDEHAPIPLDDQGLAWGVVRKREYVSETERRSVAD